MPLFRWRQKKQKKAMRLTIEATCTSPTGPSAEAGKFNCCDARNRPSVRFLTTSRTERRNRSEMEGRQGFLDCYPYDLRRRETRAESGFNRSTGAASSNNAMCGGHLDVGKLPLVVSIRGGKFDSAKAASSRGEPADAPAFENGLLPLHVAAETGNPDIVRLLLDHAASVNAISGDKGTALHSAARAGSTDAVKVLLEHDVDVDIVNQKGEAPLHVAAVNRSIEVLKALLEAGAAVNSSTESNHCTPLDLAIEKVEASGASYLDHVKLLVEHGASLSHWKQQQRVQKCRSAVVVGSGDLLELYLDNGCDPNEFVDVDGLTLLGIAAKLGHVEIGELLLDRGACAAADPPALLTALFNNQPCFVDMILKKKTGHGTSGLDAARCMQVAAVEAEMDPPSRRRMIQVLIQNGISINAAVDTMCNTVLHEAVKNGMPDSMQILVDLGADVNIQNKIGETPLTHAFCIRSVEAARIIMESKKANVFFTPAEGSHCLLAAIEREYETLTEQLLAKGAMVDLERKDGLTPLALAVSKSNAAIVKMLVNAGADASSDGGSLITTAIENEALDVIQTLLQAGADVNQANSAGDLPLAVASRCDKARVISLLLVAGANPNRHAIVNEPPLIAAIKGQARNRVLRLLLDAGADVSISDKNGVLPLMLAIRIGNFRAARILVDSGNADLQWTAQDGSHPLFEAVERESLELVSYLLDKRAPVNLAGRDEWMPLRLAAVKNNAAITRRLLEVGADPNGNPGAGPTPLIAALMTEADDRLIEILLEAGADANAKDEDGVPATVVALRRDRFEAVHVLVDSGKSDLCCQTPDGSHLLYEAVERGCEGLVVYLVARGVFVDLPGRDGCTPLKLAVVKSDRAVARMLLDSEADVASDGGSLLACAAANEDLAMLRLLLEAGADANQVGANGDLPLAVACRSNEVATVRCLMEAGAAVNGNLDGDKTPLMAAALAEADYEVFEILLRAGAYVDVVDSGGGTALHEAALHGQIGVVRLLLKHRANPFILNSCGMSARDVAADHDFEEIANLLDSYSLSMCQNGRPIQSFSVETQSTRNAVDVQFLADMEETFLCPITLDIMKDPVMAPDGHSYERSEIVQWILTHKTSPLTKQKMDVTQIIPNYTLKRQIESYLHSLQCLNETPSK